MKKISINVPTMSGLIEVTGYLFYLGSIKMVVDKRLYDGYSDYYYKWVVSEYSTGIRISEEDTRFDAMQMAKFRFNKRGEKAVKEGIDGYTIYNKEK